MGRHLRYSSPRMESFVCGNVNKLSECNRLYIFGRLALVDTMEGMVVVEKEAATMGVAMEGMVGRITIQD